jgi:hypothetical protein
MYDKMCGDRFYRDVTFRNLLMYLHNTEFTYTIPRDANRAEDGQRLRYRFAYETGYAEIYLDGPCSVLEMMIALVIRCEETIMDDPSFGDRTAQWFWGMVVNLGLGSMDDTRFDINYVEMVVTRFLNREYEPDGRGGLFTIKNCPDDLREVEIWYQMNWFLNTVI